jgi:glucokinase
LPQDPAGSQLGGETAPFGSRETLGSQTPCPEGRPGPTTWAFAVRPNRPTGPPGPETPLLEYTDFSYTLSLEGSPLLAQPVLALDVGGTHVRAAVVLDDGSRLALTKVRTPIADGPAAILDACEAALVRARDDVSEEIRSALVGVGISSPGPVDPRRGVVLQTPNMGTGFHDVPIAAELGSRLALPAFLDRDTNVAALGEMSFGAARDCADFIYLTVSTGVGGAIVMDGRILHGPDGTAGELGHTPVSMSGQCGCGAVGCLEAFLGGASMARTARGAMAAGRSPFLQARADQKGIAAIEARDVAEGEDAGDETCRSIMELGRRAFAVACVGFVDALNPSRIVIGGAIADAQGERLLGPARAAVAATAFRTPRSRVQIVRAELGGDVGLAGGHSLVIARLGDPAWRGGRATPVSANG